MDERKISKAGGVGRVDTISSKVKDDKTLGEIKRENEIVSINQQPTLKDVKSKPTEKGEGFVINP